uniref:Tolloid-like protein 1 n=1 Tax=Crassostrea virginica TaxID=6565 RepID=A0A8B8BDH1_CRAVI|nr:tolloid-like protein 1 [Crassostrea virginica]
MNYIVLVLAAFNIASAMCWQLTDLECPEDGSDITIDNIGFESRGFRFPAVGTFGFPASRTCKWTFRTEEQGARIILSTRDFFKVGIDGFQLLDTDGTSPPPPPRGFGFFFREFLSPIVFSGNTASVTLQSDDNVGDTEELSIYVIAAKDSKTCPGSTTIQATDEYQVVTSPNFPSDYDTMQDCEITVVGEKNKVIMYTVAFAAIDQYRDSECFTVLEVFDGASTDEKIFDSCNPFKPENTSMIAMREAGENLYIKFSSNEVDVDIGFAILFKLKDVAPCAARRCDPNELCFYTRDTYEEECRLGIANDNTNEREISCPEDGTEIILDVPSLESRTFRFPPRGFPISDSCTWTLRAQPGLKIVVVFRESTLVFNHVVKVLDGTKTLLELQQGDERSSQDKASSGSSLTLQLDTDSQSSEFETFAITVFGGRDSGICPGTQTVQATDSYQILTSEGFPGGPGFQPCDVTITADDGNIIVFSMLYASLNFYRLEYNDLLEIYEGTSPKKRLLSVDPFFPALNARTSGNQLRIRYKPFIVETGFLFTFKQKPLSECKDPEISSPCDPNAICSDSNGAPTCVCTEGFTGNGTECTAERGKGLSRLVPYILVSSVAGVLGGSGILFLLFLLNSTRLG